MKYVRTPLTAQVEKYELGQNLEDGFELWSNIVMDGYIVTDSLIKVKRENGDIVCPYIKHRRGHTFIGEGDYIIIEEDGTKHVCGADKIFSRYQKVED